MRSPRWPIFFYRYILFIKSYKLRNEKNNQDSKKSDIFLPTKCSLCEREIVNKLGKWSWVWLQNFTYLIFGIYMHVHFFMDFLFPYKSEK